jgi:hypothetical protein
MAVNKKGRRLILWLFFLGPVVRISPDEVSISDLESQRTIHRVGSPFLKSEW